MRPVTAAIAALPLLVSVIAAMSAEAAKPLKIGQVTRHPENFIGTKVTLAGYVLAVESAYVYFSDEVSGKIGLHDLAVTGAETPVLIAHHKYVISGTFLDSGFAPDNGSRYHLELSTFPRELK